MHYTHGDQQCLQYSNYSLNIQIRYLRKKSFALLADERVGSGEEGAEQTTENTETNGGNQRQKVYLDRFNQLQ